MSSFVTAFWETAAKFSPGVSGATNGFKICCPNPFCTVFGKNQTPPLSDPAGIVRSIIANTQCKTCQGNLVFRRDIPAIDKYNAIVYLCVLNQNGAREEKERIKAEIEDRVSKDAEKIFPSDVEIKIGKRLRTINTHLGTKYVRTRPAAKSNPK